MGVRLLIEPEVVAAMGGPVEARAKVAGIKPGEFKCVVCKRDGQLGDEPASLVVRIFAADTAAEIPFMMFAHPQCAGSRVERYGEVPLGDDAGVQAIGWVEPPGRDPRAVILVAPIATVVGSTPTGEASDRMIAGMHDIGYTPLADLTTPPPARAGLVAYGTPAALVVIDPIGALVYNGTPVGDSDWAQVAAAQGQIRVLFASGLRLDNPDRDPHADLFTAIGRGQVVGAVARYVVGAPRSRPPWRSGRTRRRGGRRR